MSINRGDLVKALREKYFDEAEANAEVFQDWKPDQVNAVKANTWERVFVNSLPPILVIGIYQTVHRPIDGNYTEVKLNDSFDFPVVRTSQ
jgi:hypothetical protein